MSHNTSETLRHHILNNEDAYCDAVNWMGAKAKEEGNHTYVEGGKVWHKNAEELIRDGYFDQYIEHMIP